MSEKPNVFPTPDDNAKKISDHVNDDQIAKVNEIYSNLENNYNSSAISEMRKRTEEQLKAREAGKIEKVKLVEEQQEKKQVIAQPIAAVSSVKSDNIANAQYINNISQPQFNTPFDKIPLPSEGKLYKNKKKTIQVSYLTTADENILTSANLLASGEFLEILINRKLLDTDIRYKDLHIGDRNAILIWLRGTSYGDKYPVMLLDENDVPFETEVSLSGLKTIKLGAEPDEEGYFDFTLPLSQKNIKFKLLTVGDLDEIDKLKEADQKNGIPVDNTGTYTLERQIVEINGVRNKNEISSLAQNMRLADGLKLREYINSIESGLDLEITVGTPGGGSIKTFLPLNIKFFWPNARL